MKIFWLIISVLLCSVSVAQQVADTTFTPVVSNPEYPFETGPVITLDEAHHNFHTLSGRYQAFGKVLSQDGYRMRSGTEKFTQEFLKNTRILTIANAVAENDNWRLPTRSAFTPEEIVSVKKWVENGGSLLLIADHMPFAGAASDLAEAFGFTFYNGFALRNGDEIFSRKKGNLLSNAITNGRSREEIVNKVKIFTGQGFKVPDGAVVMTTLDKNYKVKMPEVAWEFPGTTPEVSGEGLAHGAFMSFGEGKIVVIGEAAMFSAQLAGRNSDKVGMNQPEAKDNVQFLLNIIHWLDGKTK